MKFIEHFLPTFLLAFLIGSCIAFSEHYSFEVKKIQKITVCKQSIKTITIGFDGNVYEVICNDGSDYKFKDGYFTEQKESSE